MAPSENFGIFQNRKIEKPKKKPKSFLKNVKQIVADLEADSLVIEEVEEFVSHVKAEKLWDTTTVDALLLWVEFEEVQGIPIARLRMAPKCATEENFNELLTWMKKLPLSNLSKITFSVTIWKITAQTFNLIPGTVYSISRPSACKLYEDGPQFTAKQGNFKTTNKMIPNHSS